MEKSTSDPLDLFKHRGAIDRHTVEEIEISDEEDDENDDPLSKLSSKRKRKRKTKKPEKRLKSSSNGTRALKKSTSAAEVIDLDDSIDNGVSTPSAHSKSSFATSPEPGPPASNNDPLSPTVQLVYQQLRNSERVLNAMKNSKALEKKQKVLNALEENDKEPERTIIIALQHKGATKKFKTFRYDPFSKVVDNYSKMSNIEPKKIQFKFDGYKLDLAMTPDDYPMEEDTVNIEVVMEDERKAVPKPANAVTIDLLEDSDEDATSWYNNKPSTSTATASTSDAMKRTDTTHIGATNVVDADNAPMVKLKVSTKGRDPAKFKIAKTEKLSKVFQAYCRAQNVAENQIKFMFDGAVLNPNSTPEDLDMEDDDLIDAIFK
eukprot:TRINITY_DN3502_c0_g1_i1.p1 TRINITY_DN3502_c0_g1~~TRINITY_DN3502_c0_g1_i1.p1  ORF type:complete len:376 (-),score=106.15 TRINITY_DN3502_c0_g1_i1:47-1174(-)